MTPEQLQLVQRTYAQAGEHIAELSAAFYDRTFTLAPELRDLFPEDMTAQRTKFTDELAEIIAAVNNLDTFVGRTRVLGARHLEYGTRSGHYRIMGEALLGALGDVLGDDMTPEAVEAWELAYNLVAETMLQGAAEARRNKT
jgi:nitric oxide dioxygenase